jgi:hypothetical protein
VSSLSTCRISMKIDGQIFHDFVIVRCKNLEDVKIKFAVSVDSEKTMYISWSSFSICTFNTSPSKPEFLISFLYTTGSFRIFVTWTTMNMSLLQKESCYLSSLICVHAFDTDCSCRNFYNCLFSLHVQRHEHEGNYSCSII